MRNLLKNKLALFIAKRVLICHILLSITVLILMEQRWPVLAGLLAGSIFSVMKFGSYEWIFRRITASALSPARKSDSARIGMIGFLVNQIAVFPLLLAAFFLSRWFFAGFVAGILLVPFVIMINCVTEAFGITSNDFE